MPGRLRERETRLSVTRCPRFSAALFPGVPPVPFRIVLIFLCGTCVPRTRVPYAWVQGSGRGPAPPATILNVDSPGLFQEGRRGYDRSQVEAYFAALAAGGPPADFKGFDTVRRGYDGAEVDARLAALTGVGPDQAAATAPADPAAPPAPAADFRGFDVGMRGYDRSQVDAYLADFAVGGPPAGFHGFDTVRRGYDRAQVDAHLAALHRNLG